MGVGMRVSTHICKMQIMGGGILEMFGFAFNKKKRASMTLKFGLEEQNFFLVSK